MGKAGANFQNIGLVSVTIWTLSWYDVKYTTSFWEDLNNILEDLESINSNLTSNFESWDSCSSRSILGDKNLDLLYYGDKIYSKKANLLETTTEYIKNINEFSRKWNNSENVWKEITFLLLNGYGEAFQYCNQSLYNIVECQKSMVDDFKTNIYSLLALCPAVLVICICLLLPFYYSVVKIENDLWNTLRTRSYKHYDELKQNLLERLKNIHSEPEIAENHQKLSKNSRTFKSLWKYIWRATLLFILVVIFSLININYLYEKCADYLDYRPIFIRELINQQMLYTSLNIWATETSWDTGGYQLAYTFPSMYPFSKSITKLQDVILRIEYSDTLLKKQEFSSIISNKFAKMYYEQCTEYDYESFDFGIYSSKKILEFDAYLSAVTNGLVEQYIYLMSNSRKLNFYYSTLIDDIDNNSKNLIDYQMNIIIATLAIFILSLFVLYFGFYLTFFRSEKQYLLKIDSIIKMLPN